MKLSISLDDEATQLLLAIKKERGSNVATSLIVQEAIKAYASKLGFVLIPARVERIEKQHHER
jgi:hypothetical protein